MSFETASIGQSPIATNTAAFDLMMAEVVPGPYEFLMSSGALRTSKVLAEEPVPSPTFPSLLQDFHEQRMNVQHPSTN